MQTDGSDLDRLAMSSAGVVSRTALISGGWSTSAIDRALVSGRLRKVAIGVYRVAGAPWTRAASRHAALAAAGPGAVIARSSAAELLGLLDPQPGPHQVLVPHHRRPVAIPPEIATVTRTRTLTAADIVECAGLPTTSLARTLLDVSGSTDRAALAELLAAAANRRHLDLDDVRSVLDRNPAARGRAELRAALELLDDDGARARAEVEVVALHALVQAGLPRPAVAYTVRGRDGRFLAEVDLAYPRWRLAIEIDGFRWHSTPARKRADEERQNRLVLAGWTVLRFSATIVRSQPEVLTEAVTVALGLA
jgi:predicted transcriptional regulator of viral defense system